MIVMVLEYGSVACGLYMTVVVAFTMPCFAGAWYVHLPARSEFWMTCISSCSFCFMNASVSLTLGSSESPGSVTITVSAFVTGRLEYGVKNSETYFVIMCFLGSMTWLATLISTVS
uniref:(northern house mosquito) hypothetical protein n=1 Tax=Culex pipiens TaxID=7175 RepID=A0A8D8HFJ0_CULPI